MTRDRIAEEEKFNKESVRLNLLKDKLLRQLEDITQERDSLRMTTARLMQECEKKSTTIAELSEEAVRSRRVIAENEELISQLQVAAALDAARKPPVLHHPHPPTAANPYPRRGSCGGWRWRRTACARTSGTRGT